VLSWINTALLSNSFALSLFLCNNLSEKRGGYGDRRLMLARQSSGRPVSISAATELIPCFRIITYRAPRWEAAIRNRPKGYGIS
jgi:hypothetical protein